jgi:hypothetical protein
MTFYVRTQVFRKKIIFYVSRVKKINFDAPTQLRIGHFFVFLYIPHKMLSSHENLCTNIECQKFNIFKFIFKLIFKIGAYAPMSQNPTSYQE